MSSDYVFTKQIQLLIDSSELDGVALKKMYPQFSLQISFFLFCFLLTIQIISKEKYRFQSSTNHVSQVNLYYPYRFYISIYSSSNTYYVIELGLSSSSSVDPNPIVSTARLF